MRMKKLISSVLLFFYLLSHLHSAGFGSLAPSKSFLKPSEAFDVKVDKSEESIDIKIVLADRIHIYAKDLRFYLLKPERVELDVKKPRPVKYADEDVYYGTLNIRIPLDYIEKMTNGSYTLEVDLSGCSDDGICYQPQKFTFDFPAVKKSAAVAEKGSGAGDEPHDGFFSRLATLSADGNSATIAKALAQENILFILALFFVAGLLLAMTPCILPMIPILSSIILRQAGREGGVSRSTSMLISAVYVVSMSFTYALIGVVAGVLGFDIQAHMNNPWVIIPMASLFVALAFSLFGYFDLQLPASWQSKINNISGEAQGKGMVGTAVMGALSALVVGTCTAPVISGAIIFISMTGDAILGGLSLFVMGIGAGMPLLLVGAGADRLVPRPGGWMSRVSQIFGVMMLAMALYIARAVLSDTLYLIGFALLFMGSAFYMGLFDDTKRREGAARLFTLAAFVSLLYGSILFVGALGGAHSILDPLAPFRQSARNSAMELSSQRDEKSGRGYTLDRLLAEVKVAGRPVIVDIGKENCAACSELEHITFSDSKVKEAMKRFKFIKVDITDNTSGDREILAHFGLFGAPNILFFDSRGRALRDKFLVGFVKPEKFVEHISDIR